MKQYGVGIIGFGFMGKAHTYGYQTLSFYYDKLPFKTKLVGICSRRAETVEEARELYGFEFGTTNPDELLSRNDIDIVHVCTPNASHKDLLIKAIQAGKHIYCDKPLVTSNAEAMEVLQELKKAREAGKAIFNQMALQNRFFPVTLRAKQMIDEGYIGNPISFRASYLHSGSVDPNKPIGWKLDKSIGGGGVLFDLGSHLLDLIYHLIGKYASISVKTKVLYPKRPDSTGKIIDISAEDLVVITAEMKNGAVGTLEASKIATGTNDELRVEIHGDKGAIRFNLMEPNWLEFYDNRLSDQPLGGVKGFTRIECIQRYEKPGGSFPPSKLAIGWIRSHVHSLYNFLSCVNEGVQASPSLEEGAYIQLVMEKAYEANKSGCWVNL